MATPTTSWQRLQNVYYWLRPCYDLDWDNLQGNHKVAISSYATIIAISSKFVPKPNIIDIYSTSGAKLFSIVYNSTATDYIVDYHFHGENLVVLLNNRYRYYHDFKGNFNEYSFDQLITIDGETDLQLELTDFEARKIVNLENNETEDIFEILSSQIFENYLIIKLFNKFILVNLQVKQNYQLFQKFQKFHCFSAFNSKDNELVLAVSSGSTIISLKVDLIPSSYTYIDHCLTDGPFTLISPSYNGLIALFNKLLNTIYVIDSDFSKVYLQYKTDFAPYQMEWCGIDAIVLTFRDELRLIGPAQNSISFFYDIEEEDLDLDYLLTSTSNLSSTIPLIKSQFDGLKVMTNKNLQFLSLVPQHFVDIYQIGSNHPSKTLLDCVEKQAQHASKADTLLSQLKKDNTLESAIENCLSVAIEEFSISWQKKVLKSISFGKAYCKNGYNSDEYLRTINHLKVLNQLRSSEIGLFLTYKEIERLKHTDLVEMLLRRDQFLLALKVIELLNIPDLKDDVYAYWCCSKIKKELSMSDSDLFALISKKLVSASNTKRNYISVENIVDIANEEGRINLCKMLINLEPSLDKKINQLIKFDEMEFALITAFRSCDNELAKVVLLRLQDTLSISQFFKILSQNERKGLIQDTSAEQIKSLGIDVVTEVLPVSGDLLSHFWLHNIGKYNSKLLEGYYKQEDMRQELSMSRLKFFIKDPENSKRDTYYEDYKSKLNKASSRHNDRNKVKVFQRGVDLLELQKKLGETFQVSFYEDKSLAQVLLRLIKIHQTKHAQKVAKDYNIHPEKLWYLVLNTYSSVKEFDRLYQFIFKSSESAAQGSTKTPIGFLPIINAAFKYGAPPDHISDYIKNYAGTYEEKIGFYSKNNDVKSAIHEAYLNKDIARLKEYLEVADSTDIQSLIKGYIAKLGY